MAQRGAIFVVAGLAVATGLYLGLRPQLPAPQSPDATPAAVDAAPPQPSARQFELVVRAGRLAAGPTVLSVREDEQVILRVTSDVAEELHLHGYDLSLQLKPGQRGALVFVADRSGRFEYELERSHVALGVLEVTPAPSR